MRTSTPRIHKSVHGRSVHGMIRRPSHSEGVHGVPLILHASRPQMGREVVVVCAGINARVPFSQASARKPGNMNSIPRRVVIAHIPSPVGAQPRTWYNVAACVVLL